MPDANTPPRSTARARTAEIYQRLRHTPLSDALRLRLTARLDTANIYQDLPASAAKLVRAVTRKTRLSRVERADVARELASHFREGLDASASTEELIESFGDPCDAAKLIRRAKRRARPLPRKLVSWTAKSSLTAMLALTMIGLYLTWSYQGHPTAQPIDRLAIYNERVNAVPEPDNAWPLYYEAHKALPRYRGLHPGTAASLHDTVKREEAERRVAESAREGDPGWTLAVALADQSRDAIELMHQAAQRPTLAVPLNRGGDVHWAQDYELMRFVYGYGKATPPAMPPALPLTGAMRHHHGMLAKCSRFLGLDARVAMARGDTARATKSLTAIMSIARQIQDDTSNANSAFTGATEAIRFARSSAEHLLLHPQRFTESDLAALAHAAASWQPQLRSSLTSSMEQLGEILDITYNGDRAAFALPYTVDIYEPIMMLLGVRESLNDEDRLRWIHGVLDPLIAGTLAPRDSIERIARFELETLVTEAAKPPYRRQPLQSLFSHRRPGIATLRYAPLLMALPNWQLDFSMTQADLASLECDALVIAIAIELFRRETGQLPIHLRDIPTRLLPRIPSDPMDGAPIRYRLAARHDPDHIRAAGFLLYTIGRDGLDDGGSPHPISWKVSPLPSWFTWPGADKEPESGDYPVYPRKPGTGGE